MKMWVQRAARCFGILAVAGGVALATTSPASASAPNTGIGLRASGLIPRSPVVVSTFPGTSPNHRVGIRIPSLLSIGVVDTTTGPTSASATVGNVSVALSDVAIVRVGKVKSSCAYNPSTGTVSGDATVTNARIVLLGIPIALRLEQAPDTTIALPGGLGTLTLNHQTLGADGTLTVEAVSISLLGGLEKVVVATSVCNKAVLA